jgi:hypothetical protein
MARSNAPNDPEDDWGPAPGEEGSQSTFDEMPEPTSSNDPWLKPHHLKAREGTLELVSTSGSSEFSDVTLHITINNRPFRLGLKTFDPAYSALIKKFGKKPSAWRGTLRYRVMPHRGRADGFVTVRP